MNEKSRYLVSSTLHLSFLVEEVDGDAAVARAKAMIRSIMKEGLWNYDMQLNISETSAKVVLTSIPVKQSDS